MSKFIKSSRRPGAQEAAKIRTTFQHFDEDKDGGICMPEFVKMLSDLGIHLSDGDREELFKEMDLDKSGKIDLVEFLDHYYTLLSLSELEEAKVMQKLTDTTTFTRSEIEAMHTNFKNMSKIQNDDGLIDKTEFKSMMMNGKVASWDSFLLDGLFRMFDTDKSGGITFEEFVTNLSIYHAKVDSKETDDCRDKLMFQIYDVDQDNLISAADLSNVLTDCLNSNHMFLGEEHINMLVQETFKQVGKIDKPLSFDDYVKSMRAGV